MPEQTRIGVRIQGSQGPVHPQGRSVMVVGAGTPVLGLCHTPLLPLTLRSIIYCCDIMVFASKATKL